MPVSVVSLEETLHGAVRRYPCIAALGAFDGVHLGHRAILSAARTRAQALGVHSVALTFDRLPAEVLRPQQAPRLLTLPHERFALLEQEVDEVVVLPFDHHLIGMEALAFIEQVLTAGLGTIGVAVGFNFTFGQNARGNVELLRQYAADHSFEVIVAPPETALGEHVSSTRIRKHVAAGEVEVAQALLGRPFRLTGRIVAGDARGRVLGYPTANLAVDPRLIMPNPGVYVTQFHIDADTYSAVTAVGNRPTFAGKDISVETFVLDYQHDLYGETVHLDFLHRLRDIRKFSDAAALSAQIAKDVEATRTYLQQNRSI